MKCARGLPLEPVATGVGFVAGADEVCTVKEDGFMFPLAIPPPDKIWPLLPEIGLDVEAIRRDMNAPEIAAIVEQDLADARSLDIRKTPSFFVNGEPLRQFGYEPLVQLVSEAIAASE